MTTKIFNLSMLACVLCSTELVASQTWDEASDTLTQIALKQALDGTLHPDIFIPVYWSNNFYSGAGYSTSTIKEIDAVSGFEASKNGLTSTTRDFRINALTFRSAYFSLGLEANIMNIEKNEFGYIHDTNNVFNQGNDAWIAFDNDVDIDVIQYGAYLDLYHHFFSDKLFLRLSTRLFPGASLSVKQTTQFKPLVAETGYSESSTIQDFAYDARFESYIDLSKYLKFGFEFNYEFLPISYDLAELARNGDAFVFQTVTKETEETTLHYMGKAYVNYPVLGGLMPMIGFGSVSKTVKDITVDKRYTEDRQIVSFGFERRF